MTENANKGLLSSIKNAMTRPVFNHSILSHNSLLLLKLVIKRC